MLENTMNPNSYENYDGTNTGVFIQNNLYLE